MEILKSSRHQKIIGEFGEYMICNLLSRSGCEVTRIDHTGIDIVAYIPSTSSRIGITVKSRTRPKGKETTKVNVFKKSSNDREKTLNACEFFGCDPWIGVYVETMNGAEIYLTSLQHYDREYLGVAGKTLDTWKMGKKYRQRYKEDPAVMHISLDFLKHHWWT